LAETSAISEDFLRQLTAVGEVDILVGVPTFNNRDTIERVLSAVQVGLTKYFHRERCVLINPDGGSTDGTPEIFKNASVEDFGMLLTSNPLRTFHRVTAPYHGIPGKETALRTIFTAADLLRDRLAEQLRDPGAAGGGAAGPSATGLLEAIREIDRARKLARGNVNPQLIAADLTRRLAERLR